MPLLHTFWEFPGILRKNECVDLETFTCLSLPICLQSEIKQWSPQEAGHHSGYTSPALSCPCALASGTIHPQFKSKGTARRNECKSIHPSRQPESAKRLLEPQPSTASALNLSGTLPRNLHVLPSLRDRRIRGPPSNRQGKFSASVLFSSSLLNYTASRNAMPPQVPLEHLLAMRQKHLPVITTSSSSSLLGAAFRLLIDDPFLLLSLCLIYLLMYCSLSGASRARGSVVLKLPVTMKALVSFI